jgi:hypothetical protein
VAGDFNRDGKLDLAFTDADFNLYVGFGNGDGTFQAPQLLVNLTQQPLGYALVTADLNGDGKLDLVIPWGHFYPDYVYGFFVLLGNGDGTFQAPVSYSTPYPAYGGPAVADVNADGKPDLLLALGGETAPSLMSVLLGNGDGTFQSPIDLPTPAFPAGGNGFPSGQLAGDFNGDGKVDLLVPYTSCIDCEADSYFFFFVQGLFPVTTPPQGILSFYGYLDETSAPQPVSVSNIGLAPLTITGISLGGQNPDQFAQTNNCGSSIAVGASCQINVTFTPTVLGNSAPASRLRIMG